MKTYKKVELEAANAPSGSYAAGCPAEDYGTEYNCKKCERTE